MPTDAKRKTRERTNNSGVTRTEKKARVPRRDAAKPGVFLLTTPERRQKMISESAYYKAERRGFQGGDPTLDWLEAEAEIDASLAARA